MGSSKLAYLEKRGEVELTQSQCGAYFWGVWANNIVSHIHIVGNDFDVIIWDACPKASGKWPKKPVLGI